ncbi:MAG: hypothetical protein JO264_15930, partial [Acidisphaera sp.]|nr:hypothetical protein [Acidisphaera sp.]
MAETQEGKRTKIKTVLPKTGDEDPLLLTMVQISEAFSQPYYMDVFMYTDRKNEFDPKKLINTAATVSVRTEDLSKDREQIAKFNFTY